MNPPVGRAHAAYGKVLDQAVAQRHRADTRAGAGTMEYRTLGNSGTIVSAQCLGTMTLGKEADEATSGAILEAFVAAGGTFVDTADVYNDGASEEIIGRWLASHPTDAEQVVLATKARFAMGEG